MIIYRPIPSPQALTFDLDDTLYDNHPTIMRAERLLKEKMAAHFPKAAALSRQDMFKVKRALIKDDHRLAWDMGQLRRLTLQHILADEAGDNVEQASEELFDYFYAVRSELTIDPQIHEVLRTLADKLPLVGITNGNVDTDKIGITPYFKTVYHATIEQPAKPHGAMFSLAQDYLGCEPSRILHVGDGLTNDVLGAYRAGFSTAWYAHNRTMVLNNEKVTVLPDVQLSTLSDLLHWVEEN